MSGRGGRNNRGGGGNPSRGGKKSSGNSRSRSSNRYLTALELGTFLSTYHSLCPGGQDQFLVTIGAVKINQMVDVVPVPPLPPASERKPSVKKKHEKLWDREVIRDVPFFTEWGQRTSKERAQDQETSRLLSVSTGLVARMATAGFSKEQTVDYLIRFCQSRIGESFNERVNRGKFFCSEAHQEADKGSESPQLPINIPHPGATNVDMEVEESETLSVEDPDGELVKAQADAIIAGKNPSSSSAHPADRQVLSSTCSSSSPLTNTILIEDLARLKALGLREKRGISLVSGNGTNMLPNVSPGKHPHNTRANRSNIRVDVAQGNATNKLVKFAQNNRTNNPANNKAVAKADQLGKTVLEDEEEEV